MKVECDFKVILPRPVWDTMYGWCRAADCEVSGIGLVEKIPEGLKVHQVYLPHQECGGASTELVDSEYDKLLMKLKKEGVKLGTMKFWWHTHYNFGVFWSATDDKTADEMAGSSAEFFLSLVINQKGEYKCRLDIKSPVAMKIDDIEVEIEDPEDGRLAKKCAEDVKRLVKKKTYTVTASTQQGSYPHDYRRDYHSYLTGGEDIERKIVRAQVIDEARQALTKYDPKKDEIPEALKPDYVRETYILKTGCYFTHYEAKELGFVYDPEKWESIGGVPPKKDKETVGSADPDIPPFMGGM